MLKEYTNIYTRQMRVKHKLHRLLKLPGMACQIQVMQAEGLRLSAILTQFEIVQPIHVLKSIF